MKRQHRIVYVTGGLTLRALVTLKDDKTYGQEGLTTVGGVRVLLLAINSLETERHTASQHVDVCRLGGHVSSRPDPVAIQAEAIQRSPSVSFFSTDGCSTRPVQRPVCVSVLPPVSEVPRLALSLSKARLRRSTGVLGALRALRRVRQKVLGRRAEVAAVAVPPQVCLQRRNTGRVPPVQLRAVPC